MIKKSGILKAKINAQIERSKCDFLNVRFERSKQLISVAAYLPKVSDEVTTTVLNDGSNVVDVDRHGKVDRVYEGNNVEYKGR